MEGHHGIDLPMNDGEQQGIEMKVVRNWMNV
jgi:hypothetical protein